MMIPNYISKQQPLPQPPDPAATLSAGCPVTMILLLKSKATKTGNTLNIFIGHLCLHLERKKREVGGKGRKKRGGLKMLIVHER